MNLTQILNKLQEEELFARLENYEFGFCLSIIDRSTYPRVWRDNDVDTPKVFAIESAEHIEARLAPLPEKDWTHRFEAETIEGLIEKAVSGLPEILS